MARIATVAAVLMSLTPASAHIGNPAVGVWLDDKGDGAIEIAPCGTHLCGRIVWLRQPFDKAGKPLIDDLNPQPARRKGPVCGLQVIGGLVDQKDGSWDQGWVYDPKVGESYDLAIAMQDSDHLVITGYKGLKLFGKKFVWTRAAPNLPSCGAPATPAAVTPPAAAPPPVAPRR